MTNDDDIRTLLEKALIEEYLKEKGYSLDGIKELSPDVAEKLLKEALVYARLKLEEIEARAAFKNDLAGDPTTDAPPPKKD